MASVLTASIESKGGSARSVYGCTVVLRDYCAASSTVHGDACSASLPGELMRCLPEALLMYCCGYTAIEEELSLARLGNVGVAGGLHESPASNVLAGSEESSILYPDGVVYDLLAHHPALAEPFVQALLEFARSSSTAATGGSAGGTIVLHSLLIGQKMVQHEKLRSALLLGASSPHSLVSALTQAAAAADSLYASSVVAARQKLLSLQEIHFGAL